MSSRLVGVLYRSLLHSAKRLESDITAGRTLQNAIRSGAIDPYDGAKVDWQRERRYESRFEDAKVVARMTERAVTAATLVRTQFDTPCNYRSEHHQRVDLAFEALRELDDQNALISGLAAQGAFTPKRRSENIRFRVGDVVEVDELGGMGVVLSWSESKAHAYGELHVTYDLLLDPTHDGDRRRVVRQSQNQLRLADNPKPIQHPCIFIHFDGFANGRHVPCSALASRYPDDVDPLDDTAGTLLIGARPQAPSILQLQFADEDKLVEYLRCDDSTVIQFASAALEGRWIGQSGDDAHRRVRRAIQCIDQGDLVSAKETLSDLVDEYPEYAYGWGKLATAELKAGNVTAALKHYERALELKPQMLDALAGLGTCATRLKRWDIAHRAAMELLRVQPDNEAARLLLNNAIVSLLF